jgi:hypothetical protein
MPQQNSSRPRIPQLAYVTQIRPKKTTLHLQQHGINAICQRMTKRYQTSNSTFATHGSINNRIATYKPNHQADSFGGYQQTDQSLSQQLHKLLHAAAWNSILEIYVAHKGCKLTNK